MIQLRDYQQKAIDDIRSEFARGKKKIIFQCPTGAGKTIISAFMIQGALAKGLKVLFLVHLRELIQQTSDKLALLQIQHSVICPGYAYYNHDCQLAMMQTFSRRMDKIEFQPDLIIADESHHLCSNTYKKILANYPSSKIVGLTATPERLDGKGLGEIAEVIVKGPSMKWLMSKGFLNDYKYLSVPHEVDFQDIKSKMGDYDLQAVSKVIEESGILGDCVSHYLSHLQGKKCIVFCTTIEHSKEIYTRFRNAGVKAEHLDGTLQKIERDRVIASFKTGETKVLTNCSLISEGFDVPDCDGVILLRPTKSLGLYLQMVGRGLRPSDCPTIILDHVGNYKIHGLPDEDREWSLEGRKKRKKKKSEFEVALCEDCFSVYNGLTNAKCPYCGKEKTGGGRSPISETAGLLQEIKIAGQVITLKRNEKGKVEKKDVNKLLAKCRTLEELKSLGEQMGYKPGWANFIYQFRTKKKRVR
jgi:superfamily II DNA or RNA helicase